MARYNKADASRPMSGRSGVMGVISRMKAPTKVTHEGAAAWERDERSELFLRATSAFAGEASFYESGIVRDVRMVELVRSLAVSDFTWVAGFLRWLRSEGNMRTAPLILAVEAVHARLQDSSHGAAGADVPRPDEVAIVRPWTNRSLIASVLQRADEPGEMIAYWRAEHGGLLPKPIKRGIADAMDVMMTERSFLRYDRESAGFRIGDIIELVHPRGQRRPFQGELYKWAITARHNRDAEPDPFLRRIIARRRFQALPPVARHAAALAFQRNDEDGTHDLELAMAGQWEWLLSTLGETEKGQHPVLTKAQQWELVIPHMGYMALIRNLRNFDEAGISATAVDAVNQRIADPTQVAMSRQLPFRFYSAYQNTTSDNWRLSLGRALDYTLTNVPTLTGRTLVLIDTSHSMTQYISHRSKVTAVEQAIIFGTAIAHRNRSNVDVWGWASGQFKHELLPGSSVLTEVQRINEKVGSVGMGTDMLSAVRRGYAGHDRVIILSDMQSDHCLGHGMSALNNAVPSTTPIYCFNLSAYGTTPLPTGTRNRVDIGGMTDTTFSMINQLESGEEPTWPWIAAASSGAEQH